MNFVYCRAKTKNYVSVGWRPANTDKTCKRFFLDKNQEKALPFVPKGRGYANLANKICTVKQII